MSVFSGSRRRVLRETLGLDLLDLRRGRAATLE
jgi:hypothetical protein